MNFLSPFPSRLARVLGCALLLNLIGWAATPEARADYRGPVPAPTDAFGARGPYRTITETWPSPGWADELVTVVRPEGATGPRPVWFFAHGFSAIDPQFYGELLEHLASHGAFVVFSPYPVSPLQVAANYDILFAGFAAAVERYGAAIDTSRVGFAGHSYGAGAVPALALRGVRERGWGGEGLALLLLAPWYSYFVSDADLASFPAHAQAVVQIYEDDTMNDHRMAIDLFTRLNLSAANKDFLMVRSDRIDGYNYAASHRVPTGASVPGETAAFNALDGWAVARIAQALAASAFAGDAAGRTVALGNGTAEQTQMGATPDGRRLRPMIQSDAPVPLFPTSRYIQSWDAMLNPRREASLPAPVQRPHLANISARARAADGAGVLIVGAVITGPRPKSLLVRAVGPRLADFGVDTAMHDPQLTLYRGGAAEVAIDDWGQTPNLDTLQAATFEVGAGELREGSRDAAILLSHAPGTLTAHAGPADGEAGVVVLELFDAEKEEAAMLLNLSARSRVGEGEEVLIGGFVVTGGPLRVLVRGLGPALAGSGLPDVLGDPELELYRGNVRIATNDDWSAQPEAAEIVTVAAAVGASALTPGGKDACLLATLPPGVYSAHLRPRDGRAGAGMIELFVAP